MRLNAPIGLGLLFAMTGPLTADDAKDEAIKKDRKKYEGTWRVVSLEVDGNKLPEEDAKKFTVVNEADGKWAIEVEGKVIARGTSEIDPTKKPKAVDLTVTEGDNKGQTVLGIYEFEDDTRKVCLGRPGEERPTEFSPKAGGWAHPRRPQAGEEVREGRRYASDRTSCFGFAAWLQAPTFQLHAGTAQV